MEGGSLEITESFSKEIFNYWHLYADLWKEKKRSNDFDRSPNVLISKGKTLINVFIIVGL